LFVAVDAYRLFFFVPHALAEHWAHMNLPPPPDREMGELVYGQVMQALILGLGYWYLSATRPHRELNHSWHGLDQSTHCE
jgi:hypothetical protein